MEILILYFLLAVGISFLCSLLEATLLSVTPYFIQGAIENKKIGAKILKKTKEDIDFSISAILTINTFANTLGASGVGAEAMRLFGEKYMFFASAGLTLAILFVSEIIPKTIGALYWQKLAIPASYIIRILVAITYPLLMLTSIITKMIKKDERQKISRDEIRAISEIGEEDGVLNESESNIIENLLNLKEKKIKDILTPRRVVFMVEADDSIEEFFRIKDYDNFSRIPVYEKNVDNIIGFVPLRKLLIARLNNKNSLKMRELIMPIFSISHETPILNALELFIKRKEHLFVTYDRFFQMSGVVSLEDVVETLLGAEITDEFDDVEDLQKYAKLIAKQKNRR